MSYRVCAGILTVFLTIVSGCNPKIRLTPETIDLDERTQFRIEGSQESADFCLDLTVETDTPQHTLHSLNLIDPDGAKLAPDSWEDTTPAKPQPTISFGVGMGMGARDSRTDAADCPSGHDDDHHGGHSGVSTGIGIGLPLFTGDDDPPTSIAACWLLGTADAPADLSQYTLQINLMTTAPDQIELTTATLALAYHEDDEEEDEHGEEEEDDDTAADLVREIDFTMKSRPTTKTIQTRRQPPTIREGKTWLT